MQRIVLVVALVALLFLDDAYAYRYFASLGRPLVIHRSVHASRNTKLSAIGGGFFDSLRNTFFGGKKEQDVIRTSEDDAQVAPFAVNKVASIIPVKKSKIVIIGAGISGLACANELLKTGEKDFVVLESSDAPGGRVRTDVVDGYKLDRGFQVFIDSYPEAQQLFDYEKLQLQQFWPGAIVRYDGGYHLVADPFRRPQDIFASVFTPIGSFFDKLKVSEYYVVALPETEKYLYQDAP
jgi:hypothetical protein